LGGRKYPEIAKALKVPVDDVHEAVKAITKLDPKPGRLYANDVATYIMPEIAVQKVNGDYVVILNDEQLPHVRISRHYRRLLSDPGTTAEVKTYVRERIRSGAFLIKSIHQRQKTITRIATEIVERQTEFLDHGITRLKPMTMAEVADAVGVHETTVSRAVSAKYMRTPRGIFELKYFFTPGIKNSSGADLSNMTVKHMIKEMVDAEDSAKPLSDQELVARLQAQGIKIARRTIAKYRLILHIPPSHMRKGY
jgi:RNA polymerase sigma-54 factor